MNVVIMGSGRVASELAVLLDQEGHKVVVISLDASEFDRLPPDFHGKTVLGDATDETVLRKAGLQNADAFIALTRVDNRNAMAAQIAKHIFGVRKVMCRIYDLRREEFYKALGLEAISPINVFARLVRGRLEE
ncbi:MAG: TrkA family potassium uptake protein [Dehalococcoidia bacterium]|nr:TrkA family potassium uptake protein [Dehalococcoidia bacterium]